MQKIVLIQKKYLYHFQICLKKKFFIMYFINYFKSCENYLNPFPMMNKLERKYPGFYSFIWPLFKCYELNIDDYLYRIGEDLNEMYKIYNYRFFTYHGELSIINNDLNEKVPIGSILGEICLLFEPNIYILSCHECKCNMITEILTLRRDDLSYISSVSENIYNDFKSSILSNYSIKQPIYIDPNLINDEIKENYSICEE